MDYAKMSELHYGLSKKPTKKQIKNLEKEFDGYKVNDKSDHNVLGMYNEEKKHLHINHRGTSKTEDIFSDLLHLHQMGNLDPQSDSRRKQTKEMIKDYPNDTKVSLSGHSYGGATILDALEKSPSLDKHIDEVHLYNPLIAKLHKKNDKVTIHRTPYDIVSLIPTENKTMTHETKFINPLEAHHLHHFYK